MSAFLQTLKIYLRAGYPILYVVTAEEQRAIDLISAAVTDEKLAKRKVFVWSISRGLCTTDFQQVDPKTGDPKRILPMLADLKTPGIFILEDFHAFVDDRSPTATLVVRQMRDLVLPFQSSQKTLVLLSPVLRIPPELEKSVTVVDLDLPSEEELVAVLNDTADSVRDRPNIDLNLDGNARERIVKALTGLTQIEAENALAKVVVTRSRLDPEDIDLLLAEKEQIIRKSGTLEYYASPEQFGSIGGMDNLKDWLRKRGKSFSEAAREFGLPYPRGLLLVGVPGCGKSLTAKAVSAEWKMPLLKFDLGRVFASLVGQAEENMRNALKMAQAVAPCVLWIDEIEKGLAGARGGQGDGGVSARIFGTLLTWMEENRQPVFVVATANDIEGTPPELLRKGRFDEVFFVDLPTPQERAMVLAIHLTRHRRDHREFNLAEHALAAEGFSGAELEQAVVEALFDAFSEGDKTKMENRHMARAIRELVPLSRSMERRIAALRNQARDKWRMASGAPESKEEPKEILLPEPPPVPQKRRRIFEV